MKLRSERRTDGYYSVELYTGDQYLRTPMERRFDHWQSAYAYAKSITREDCGIREVHILRRTYDAYIYRGILKWTRSHGRII
jgi:hypothetical protein